MSTAYGNNAIRVSNPQEQFAVWLAQNQPEVFQALVASATKHRQMNGITDWLTSVGTSLGGAVKSVGSFISSPQGMATLGTIGTVYLQTQAQKDALKLQVAQVQAGYSPAPVYTSGSGATAQPYYRDPVTGQSYPLTSQLASQLQPATNWVPIAAVGGGIILVLILLSGRKS